MLFQRIVFALALLTLPTVWLVTTFASATSARAAVLPPVSTVCKAPSSSNDGTLTVEANGEGEKKETAIVLSVVDSGVTVTLKDVRNALVASGNGDLLSVDPATHIWTLNRSLLVREGVTLRIAGGASIPAGERVDWLRMRSNPGSGSGYDYSAFAPLRVRDAALELSNTKLTSWDTTGAGAFDTNYEDGRAYVLAKGEARMDIAGSELSYLGSADGESYGVSWRDNEQVDGKPRTCVTGNVTDSIFAHNYYGIYTFQAANMQFVRNIFRDNVQYGFDPHDYTHDVLVQDNVAEGNGNHGFIISRGCFKFTFRGNISRNNKLKSGSRNPSAHGFMLDPGSPNSSDPPAPSVSNVFDNNQAYGNDGYGFRILGSNDNTISNNQFYNNRLGITLEDGSSGNQIIANQILSSTGLLSGTVLSQGYGISLNGGSNGNTIDGNTVRANANAGIYVRVGSSVVQNNTVENNGADGIAILPESSGSASQAEGAADDYVQPQRAAPPPAPAATTPPNNNQLIGNSVRGNANNGLTIKGAAGTLVKNNTFNLNGYDGVAISAGTTNTTLEGNTSSLNAAYGIELYGTGVTRVTMTRNSLTGNVNNAISVRNGSNEGILPPTLLGFSNNTLQGFTRAEALVEVFSDAGNQAANYEGAVRADTTGFFSFTFTGQPKGAYITATITEGANTSGLSAPLAAVGTPTPQPTNTPLPEPTDAPPPPTATPTPRPRVLLPVVAR